VWMKDASQNAIAAAQLLDEHRRADYQQHLDNDYQQLRTDYEQQQSQLLSLEEARKRKPDFFGTQTAEADKK